MRRNLTITLLTAALLVAGCGGDDDDSATGPADPAGATEQGTSEQLPAADGPAGSRVVIDGEEYLLPQQLLCYTGFGSFNGEFSTDDGTIRASIDMPPEDADALGEWDPPAARVDIGDDKQWVIGFDEPEYGDGTDLISSFDSIERSENSIVVTGTFVEVYSFYDPSREIETATGSVEMVCP